MAAPHAPCAASAGPSGISQYRRVRLTQLVFGIELGSDSHLGEESWLHLGRALRPGRAWSREQSMRALLGVDSDGDGRVSLEEFLGHAQGVLSAVPDLEFDKALAALEKALSCAPSPSPSPRSPGEGPGARPEA